jgi:hypothetical protein
MHITDQLLHRFEYSCLSLPRVQVSEDHTSRHRTSLEGSKKSQKPNFFDQAYTELDQAEPEIMLQSPTGDYIRNCYSSDSWEHSRLNKKSCS